MNNADFCIVYSCKDYCNIFTKCDNYVTEDDEEKCKYYKQGQCLNELVRHEVLFNLINEVIDNFN